MAVEKEFFNVKYKEGTLDAKTAQLIFFAVSIAIGHEDGATLHVKRRGNAAPAKMKSPRRWFTRCARPPPRCAISPKRLLPNSLGQTFKLRE